MKNLLKQYFTITKTKVPDASVTSSLFNTTFNETLINNSTPSRDFLRDVLWPLVSTTSRCHDSVSCQERWTTSSRSYIEIPRKKLEYLGQEFDAHNELRSKDNMLVDNLDDRGCVNGTDGNITNTYSATTIKTVLQL